MVPNNDPQKPMVQNISCIIPETSELGGLFLGNVFGAQNAPILKEYGIRAVITTSAETNIAYDFEDIPFHLSFQGHDKQDYYISEHVNDCIHFIEQNRKFTNVLVHCYAGVSRSSAIIISYLMWKYRWNLNKTLEFTRFKRIVAKPNDGFLRQLSDVQNKLGLRKQQSNAMSRTNVQKILSPRASQTQQQQQQQQIPEAMRPLSRSRPSSHKEPVNVQKPHSPPPPNQFAQKMQPFAQLAQMQDNHQSQYRQVQPESYPTYPAPPQMQTRPSYESQQGQSVYIRPKLQGRSSQGPRDRMQKSTYQNLNHKEVPIPRFLNRRSQYSKGEEQTVRKTLYNDYMSPQMKPTSPRNHLPPKYSAGKMENTSIGLGSPVKPMSEWSNNFRQGSIYSTNYSKKTADHMETSKKTSRCLVRPKDLPGYRTSGSKQY